MIRVVCLSAALWPLFAFAQSPEQTAAAYLGQQFGLCSLKEAQEVSALQSEVAKLKKELEEATKPKADHPESPQ